MRDSTGRPSKFTETLADEILERISNGKPLAVMCREEHFPHRSTVSAWCLSQPDFAARYAQAREIGFDAIACRVREIARGVGESTKDVQRDKLIIETDLKLLAKWDPKRYGDKIDLNATGVGEIRIVVGGDTD
ncbi:hypothetical protein HQ447_20650 [bacterium]|nr:hypothetical protein [bacterium]